MTFGGLISEFVAEPLGFSWPDLVLVIVLITSLIFFALGLRSALILMWLSLGLTYIVFHGLGINPTNVLVLFVATGVIMVVSLLISHSREKSGVVGL